jgi:hypothetical protein
LLIINHGAATATNVIVTNPIPSGNPEITFLPSASDTACSVVSGSITCNLGNGPSGQARALSIAFFVPTVSSCTPVTIHNVANVRADQEDTNFTNNVSNTISTTLLCPSVTVDPTPLNDPYIPYNTYIPYEHYDSYMEQGSSSRGICRTLERTHGSVSKRRGKKKVRISKGLERLLKECRSYGRIRNLEG